MGDKQTAGSGKIPLKRLVMSDLDFSTIMWAKMEPDVYGGDNLDEHVPQWRGWAVGDIGDETFQEPLTLDPKDYPPGTKVTIETPVCPKCGDIYENCMVRGGQNPCDFDWKQLVDNSYS